MSSDLSDKIETLLKLKAKNIDLYSLAFTHSSCTRDDKSREHNERLEFLGDAVLKLIFSNYLFNEYPKDNEGILTKYRSRLISDDLLAEISRSIKLPNLIEVGSNLKSQQSLPNSVVGDALEALLGAIYLDQGYKRVETFVLKTWKPFIEKAIEDSLTKDYKSSLQEVIQSMKLPHPEYKTIESSGPSHDMVFTLGVYIDNKLVAQGKGSSKKDAGQQAAKEALEVIREQRK